VSKASSGEDEDRGSKEIKVGYLWHGQDDDYQIDKGYHIGRLGRGRRRKIKK
jgi:hypothetical protein